MCGTSFHIPQIPTFSLFPQVLAFIKAYELPTLTSRNHFKPFPLQMFSSFGTCVSQDIHSLVSDVEHFLFDQPHCLTFLGVFDWVKCLWFEPKKEVGHWVYVATSYRTHTDADCHAHMHARLVSIAQAPLSPLGPSPSLMRSAVPKSRKSQLWGCARPPVRVYVRVPQKSQLATIPHLSW